MNIVSTISVLDDGVAISILLFFAAAILEIGGGYLVWLWLREGRSVLLAAPGAGVLSIYGAVQTVQPTHFGRVYAAYGGVSVITSVAWSFAVDGRRPDRFEVLGGLVALTGMLIMMYAPR